MEEEKKKICPITGLEIISKPEWTNLNFDVTDYNLTINVYGGKILVNEVSGHSNMDGIIKYFENYKTIEENYLASKYIVIENYTKLTPTPLNVRKYYIDFYKNKKNVLAMIFVAPSAFLKLMIELGKLFVPNPNFIIKVCNDLEEALTTANTILKTTKD